MAPVPTFWMKQRQIKMETVDDTRVKLTAPNLPPCEVVLQPEGESAGWRSAVYQSQATGEPALLAESEAVYSDPITAWDVGFELYRESVVV